MISSCREALFLGFLLSLAWCLVSVASCRPECISSSHQIDMSDNMNSKQKALEQQAAGLEEYAFPREFARGGALRAAGGALRAAGGALRAGGGL